MISQKKCDKWKEMTELAESIRLAVAVRCGSANLILRWLAKTAYSCCRHGPVTAWFWAARPGNVITVPKNVLCCEWEYIVCHNGIVSVQINFFVLSEFSFVTNWTASKKLHSAAGYETMFSERTVNVWRCVRGPPPPPRTACIFTTKLEGVKRTQYFPQHSAVKLAKENIGRPRNNYLGGGF
jgi:hypothetical protein